MSPLYSFPLGATVRPKGLSQWEIPLTPSEDWTHDRQGCSEVPQPVAYAEANRIGGEMPRMLKSVLNVELLCHIDSFLHKYECDPIIHWTAHRGGGEMRLAIVTKRQIGFQFTIREFNHCRTNSGYADRINCAFAMCWGPRASRSARLIPFTRWIRNSDGRIRTEVMTRRKIRSTFSNRTNIHKPLLALCWIDYLNYVFLSRIEQPFTSHC